MNKWLDKLKRKETILVIVLVGLILLVISIPTQKEDTSSVPENHTQEDSTSNEDYCTELEKRLEEILECIHGVGNVKVMITLKDTGQSVVEKDSGGEDDSEKKKWSEETVYEEIGSNSYPYVVNTYQPQIQGVLVVAQGVEDPMIQKQIMDGVMALFGVESHKISIINME